MAIKTSVFQPESVKDLVVVSTTQVKLPAGSFIRFGGMGYVLNTDLLLSPSLAASTIYSVYVVLNAGEPTLVSSTNGNAIGPVGYTKWKLVGLISSNASSQIASAGFYTQQRFTSGSGTYSLSSPDIKYIRVRIAGGGGGGGGVSGGGGGTGGTTTFGSSLLTATGGSGGSLNGGAGGTTTVNSPAVAIVATNGGSGSSTGSIVNGLGQIGGANPLGGAGGGSGYNSGISAGSGAANTGAGGGGGATQAGNQTCGAGGGAGGYIEAIITVPQSSYAYSVGGGGTSGGSFAGTGGSGVIIVEEFYQF